MLYLGIEGSTGLVFEGGSPHGARLILPLPLLTPAKFFSAELADNLIPAEITASGEIPEYYFREDAFDPVTRIRRGRFYKQTPTAQPDRWRVMLAPPIAAEAGLDNRNVFSFGSINSSDIKIERDQQLVIVLGVGGDFSVWTFFNKERVHTGEILFSLKARNSMGGFPVIDWSLVPDRSGLVKSKIEGLLDDMYRAGAESIVDRAREAATAILSAYLQNEGIAEANGKDLGGLTELLDKRNGKNAQRIVRCAAEIPQRLHSRGKHAEQEKLDNLRPIREQDAELAVQCVGVMLCDLGWARWL